MISSVIGLHPDFILEILELDTDVLHDINLIIKLDNYTKKNNNRNYNKTLISDIKS